MIPNEYFIKCNKKNKLIIVNLFSILFDLMRYFYFHYKLHHHLYIKVFFSIKGHKEQRSISRPKKIVEVLTYWWMKIVWLWLWIGAFIFLFTIVEISFMFINCILKWHHFFHLNFLNSTRNHMMNSGVPRHISNVKVLIE